MADDKPHKLEEGNEEDEERQENPCKELAIYMVFLLLLYVQVLYKTWGVDAFYLRQELSNLIIEEEFLRADSLVKKTYMDIGQVQEFWQFMHGPFVENVFPSTCYPGGVQPSPSCAGYIDLNNRVLGGVRIWQLRTKNATPCNAPKSIVNTTNPQCYPSYSTSTESTATFGGNQSQLGPALESAFTYQSFSPVTASTTGVRSNYGGAGGFVWELPVLEKNPRAVVAAIENSPWIDIATRAIFIDFSVYDVNINHVCAVRLVVEFLSTGAVIPKYYIRCVPSLFENVCVVYCNI